MHRYRQKIQMHSCNYRIYYEDTDAGGIVYHANYLKFAERGRTEMIRDLGISNGDLKNDHNILIVVRHIDINYNAPVKLEDMITVKSTVSEIGKTSFTMVQKINRDGLTCATLIVKLVCIDSDSGRAVRMPQFLKEKINEQ
jgi:acyl-CoA thioester hydrolase